MKVIIAGSRTIHNYSEVKEALNRLELHLNDVTVISGTARGADKLGEQWAEEYGKKIIRMPADWDRYGKSAGYRRNEEMAKIADMVIIFWDGESRGSKHMLDIAKKRGLPTYLYIPDKGMHYR